ncbi:MAG: hypothetical protein ACFFE1_16300 [Candidatus Thorarchaeota archaeon]
MEILQKRTKRLDFFGPYILYCYKCKKYSSLLLEDMKRPAKMEFVEGMVDCTHCGTENRVRLWRCARCQEGWRSIEHRPGFQISAQRMRRENIWIPEPDTPWFEFEDQLNPGPSSKWILILYWTQCPICYPNIKRNVERYETQYQQNEQEDRIDLPDDLGRY